MRAALYSRYGGPDAVILADTPVPEPGPGQLRVRVAAAGVNPLDWKLVRGDLRFLRGKQWPKRLGIDFAGAVDAVGLGVSEWKVGETLFGSLANPLEGTRGAFAEQVLVNISEVVRKPPMLSFAMAAALPIAGVSALQCLDLAEVKSGAEILVIGGAGGVGSFCTVAAAGRGAKVTAVCRAANDSYVGQLGAAHTILYDQTDPLQTPARFDAIIDAAGVQTFGRCQHLLKPKGIYVLTLPGPRHFFQMLRSRFFGGKQARGLMAKVTQEQLERLAQLASTPAFRAVACTTVPFSEVQRALEQSRAAHTKGKLVLEVART